MFDDISKHVTEAGLCWRAAGRVASTFAKAAADKYCVVRGVYRVEAPRTKRQASTFAHCAMADRPEKHQISRKARKSAYARLRLLTPTYACLRPLTPAYAHLRLLVWKKLFLQWKDSRGWKDGKDEKTVARRRVKATVSTAFRRFPSPSVGFRRFAPEIFLMATIQTNMNQKRLNEAGCEFFVRENQTENPQEFDSGSAQFLRNLCPYSTRSQPL